MSDITKDFRLFTKSNGMLTTSIDDQIKKINDSITPTVVLEERQMNVAAMDIFSRLLYDRQILFGNEFNQDTCNLLIAQLLYLNSVDGRDISLLINSPGGSVIDGLAVIDTINYIDAKVSTICVGMAASMGAVLLSCGAKDNRFVLPHSRVMIHQVSSAMKGTFSDMKIEFEQTERCKKDIYAILAENMGKTYEEVEALCDRNNWFIGQEAVELGIVDGVLVK